MRFRSAASSPSAALRRPRHRCVRSTSASTSSRSRRPTPTYCRSALTAVTYDTPLHHRHTTVASPLHHLYTTVTSPLRHHYATVTSPTPTCCRYALTTVTSPLHHRYVTCSALLQPSAAGVAQLLPVHNVRITLGRHAVDVTYVTFRSIRITLGMCVLPRCADGWTSRAEGAAFTIPRTLNLNDVTWRIGYWARDLIHDSSHTLT